MHIEDYMCFFYQIVKRIIGYNHNIFKFDLSKLATQVNEREREKEREMFYLTKGIVLIITVIDFL